MARYDHFMIPTISPGYERLFVLHVLLVVHESMHLLWKVRKARGDKGPSLRKSNRVTIK